MLAALSRPNTVFSGVDTKSTPQVCLLADVVNAKATGLSTLEELKKGGNNVSPCKRQSDRMQKFSAQHALWVRTQEDELEVEKSSETLLSAPFSTDGYASDDENEDFYSTQKSMDLSVSCEFTFDGTELSCEDNIIAVPHTACISCFARHDPCSMSWEDDDDESSCSE